jgi:protein-tyrosine phosphatase
MERRVTWQGCFNARDLGGFRASGGRRTRIGAIVRADQLAWLSSAGWSALYEYGIRTVVDLQNADDRAPDVAARPADVTTVNVPLEDHSDAEFWDRWGARSGLYCTPLYYRAFLERFPERCAAAVAAIARAPAGGVLVHCRVGRDRTGLVALLLLSFAGVAPEEIADDYEISSECLPAYFAARGEEDEGPAVAYVLRRENTTARAGILRALDGFDADAYLRSAGLGDADLDALRARFYDTPSFNPE